MWFYIRKIILGIIFIAILVAVIALARGYRYNPQDKSLKSTGILVASSFPDGAKIYLNGELKGATNSNITVQPGDYFVEIKKDGFTSWSKQLKIKGELVLKADALLFPQNPTLSPVTSLGVSSAFQSASGNKIVVVSETNNPEKDGIYIFENGRNPLSRINPLKLLLLKESIPNNSQIDLSTLNVQFSPDEEDFIVTLYVKQDENTDTKNNETEPVIFDKYLLSTSSETLQPFTVLNSEQSLVDAWQVEQAELTQKALEALKAPLAEVAIQSFNVISFSPDESKILYTASESATLPLTIDPPLIAANQTPETRNIEPGNVYVYDVEEDKNFLFAPLPVTADGSSENSLQELNSLFLWYPDSAHIVTLETNDIVVYDYDATNHQVVYSGPFEKSFVSVSKDGQLFILTNFNSRSGDVFDLYSVGIK